jgi:hypothetical protein
MQGDDNKLGANNLYFNEVEGEEGLELELEESLNNKFVGLVSDRYASAKQARDYDESRWINAYHNYRGLYAKHAKFRESEKSRVFVKVTKTKVLAAFGQLVDVVFGSNKLPIGISESKIPEGISEYAHLDTSTPLPGIETTPSAPEPAEQRGRYDVGYAGDNVLNAGATYSDKGQFEDMDVALKDNLKDGPTIQPGIYQTKPAQEAARRMEKLIHDQILMDLVNFVILYLNKLFLVLVLLKGHLTLIRL